MNFDPSQFDPSKMDPKLLMEMSRLIQQLPPEKLNRMQTLMHNMMAGFDVRAEMEAFEQDLPAGFREKLASIIGSQAMGAGFAPTQTQASPPVSPISPISNEPPKNIHEARLTILRAVSENRLSPEQALEMLFP